MLTCSTVNKIERSQVSVKSALEAAVTSFFDKV